MGLGYIINTGKHIGYYYLHIFLRDIFINFDRYYNKPATRVFTLKNVCFLVQIHVQQIKLCIWIYFKPTKTHWLLLFTTFF